MMWTPDSGVGQQESEIFRRCFSTLALIVGCLDSVKLSAGDIFGGKAVGFQRKSDRRDSLLHFVDDDENSDIIVLTQKPCS